MSLTPEEITRGLTLTVPMPANIANGAHRHWSAVYRDKNAYWDALDAIAAGTRARHSRGITLIKPCFVIPEPPPEPFPRATIRSVMHLGAAMDQSNSMRRHKWIEDWLKTRKYIVDDRKKCLTWEGFPEQIIKRSAIYRIVLTLTPL